MCEVLIVRDNGDQPPDLTGLLSGAALSILKEVPPDEVGPAILELTPDIVIQCGGLDPERDCRICRELRAVYDGKVLVITGNPSFEHETRLLECGADDVLAEPVSAGRLSAHLSALARRSAESGDNGNDSRSSRTTISVGGLKVDLASRTALIGRRKIALPASEFETLWFLARRAGRVVSRDEMYQGLLKTEYDGLDRRIDLRISRLRRRLGDTERPALLIRSVRHDGYLLVQPSASD